MLARSARQIDRFDADDGRWLRGAPRRLLNGRPAPPQGRFNAGQKVNAWLSCASILVLLGTGVIMYFVGLAPLPWRTGATFVHDWVALAVGLLVIGHIYRAVQDAEARRGMRTGAVDAPPAKLPVRTHQVVIDEDGAINVVLNDAVPNLPPGLLPKRP